MTIESQIAREGDRLVVTLAGRMTFRDYAGAGELLGEIFARIDPAAEPPVRRIVFNLAAVAMVDSHWLGMFVRAQRQAEEAGLVVVLKSATPAVARLFDLVQFNRVFQIEA